jgi:dolichol-phosphate mannosyltransferase
MRYSILIPAHNEADNLPPLLQEISSAMHQLEGNFEIIVIDDGSTDDTFQILSKIVQKMPQLRVLQLASREGQSAALCAGIKEAKGPLIITLDGDGQNDPEDIPKLVDALNGYDCVTGNRIFRQDSWLKRNSSLIANAMRRFLLKDSIKDTGCSLKIFTASSLRSIPHFAGMHRFLPSLLMIYGFAVREIPVSHRQRLKGSSKYSLFNRCFSSFCDLLGVFWLKHRRIVLQIIGRLP